MSKLSIDDCQRIYAAAIAANACAGQARAAKRALDAGDVDAFERVCRYSVEWLRAKRIAYELTDGIGELWHANGALWERVNYKNGKRHGSCETWHADGTLRYRENYANGRLHGLCEDWYANGTLRSRVNCANGELHGLYETWHENGALRYRATYADDRLHGLYEEWRANGVLRYRVNYENGVLISDLTNEATL